MIFQGHSPTFSGGFPHPRRVLTTGVLSSFSKEVSMAYRELGMIELREVVRRWWAGDGFRAIARSR